MSGHPLPLHARHQARLPLGRSIWHDLPLLYRQKQVHESLGASSKSRPIIRPMSRVDNGTTKRGIPGSRSAYCFNQPMTGTNSRSPQNLIITLSVSRHHPTASTMKCKSPPLYRQSQAFSLSGQRVMVPHATQNKHQLQDVSPYHGP